MSVLADVVSSFETAEVAFSEELLSVSPPQPLIKKHVQRITAATIIAEIFLIFVIFKFLSDITEIKLKQSAF